ncbi:hypothetical protein BST83_11470 [Polaribacter filamentus]|uniref:Secretion system C-terminal sorting domain-containing protein n=2 Tax=Polaribacter filamentus TaxID=53483 RepID=A0A2S7KYK1_9FLAO|nr:hypothetical protein BST83_11470 [Polaribacter filamentus]
MSGHADTDKYRIMIIDDPSTTITVGWNQISGLNPTVHYDTVDHGTDHTLYGLSKTADRTINYRGMNNHFARITGLTPNSAYYFIIKDDQGVSQRLWFKTSPSDNSRLSFVAGGDSRNNRTPRQNANRLVHKLKPNAVLFGGDMTSSDNDSQWQDWFDDWQLTIAPDGRIFPIIPARGNHENSSVVYNLFDTPNVNSYYAVTFGNNLIRTYTLNSEISVLGDQLTWLQNDLAASTSLIWKTAQYHKPMRPHTSGKSEGNSGYDAWAQLFYDKGVRLVVDCDSHVAKTTYPVMPSSGSGSEDGFIVENNKGTIYTGEGCWGAPLRPYDDSKSWTRNGGAFNQVKLIFVDENKIELRTILVNSNASSVDEVSNNDPFSLPVNLQVFSPSTGEVVLINKNTTVCPDAGTACDDGNSQTINDLEDGYCNCYGVPDCVAAGTACDDGDSQTINDEEDGNCNCIGIPSSASLTYQVSAGDDDAEESETGGNIDIGSSDLELVYDTHEDKFNQTVGIRFNEILIPKDANILSAYIQFTVKGTNSEATTVSIKGENTPNSMVFTETTFNISQRPTTTEFVDWTNIPEWTTIDAATTDQRTPDLKAIVQEIVNLQDWKASNSMSFIITGTGSRTARSYNGSTSRAPWLFINYNTSGTSCDAAGTPCDDGNPETSDDVEDGNCNCAGTPDIAPLEYEVSDNNDDAEENEGNGSIGLTSSDLELGQDHSTKQIVGIRFNSIDIPKNVEILSAYIQFTVKGITSNEDPTSVSIKGEKVPNSETFSDTAFNISQRPTTTEAVDWTNIPVWSNIDDASADQKTPDLKAIVQEIVDLQDWQALNSMSFIISGTGSREARSHDGSSSRAPKLFITYKSNTLSTSKINKASTKVYPNPASNLVYIQSNKNIENVSLYSILGQKVLSINPKNNAANLDIAPFKSGIYFIHLKQNNNQVSIHQLIIK